MLYDLYAITPGIQYEGQWQFSQFIPAEAAKCFNYLNDAEDFYQKAPAFPGSGMLPIYRKCWWMISLTSIKQLRKILRLWQQNCAFSHAGGDRLLLCYQLPVAIKRFTTEQPYRCEQQSVAG